MVMRFGMSDKLGPRVFGHDHGQPFLGREFSSEPDYSDEIAREIDDEVRRIIEGAHQVAKDILGEHREGLETISEILLKRETLEREEFEALLIGTPEQEIWGPDADEVEPGPERPELPGSVARDRESAKRSLPRPGLAGGAAEIRGLDPEKPEPA
jgi:cell division protease FtsH